MCNIFQVQIISHISVFRTCDIGISWHTNVRCFVAKKTKLHLFELSVINKYGELTLAVYLDNKIGSR